MFFPEVEPLAAVSAEISPGSTVAGNKRQTDNASWYLSLKDCAKPVYRPPVQELAELSAKSGEILNHSWH